MNSRETSGGTVGRLSWLCNATLKGWVSWGKTWQRSHIKKNIVCHASFLGVNATYPMYSNTTNIMSPRASFSHSQEGSKETALLLPCKVPFRSILFHAASACEAEANQQRVFKKGEPFKPLQFIQIAPDVIFKGMEWLLASLMLGSLSSKIGIEKWRHLDSPSPGFGWGCCHLYTGGMVPPNWFTCWLLIIWTLDTLADLTPPFHNV